MSLPNRWPMSRRTLLRGAGAAISLPILEAMLPRSARAAAETKPPVRLAVLYMPNGVYLPAWYPAGRGKDYPLSPILEPLGDLKHDVNVFTNFRNSAGLLGDGHYAKTSSWLTGKTAVRTSGKGIRAGISIDQFVAEKNGRQTPLASIELGIDPVHNIVDMGYSTVYGCHVSWRTPTLPAAKEIDPQQAFDRLFRSSQFGRSPSDRSVIDIVHEDARRLRKDLGGSDRQKLDEYLDSVRELEKRIELATHAEDRNWQPRGSQAELVRPTGPYGDYTTHVRLMLDIILLGFRSDTTRVASFMFANDVSGRNFSFVDGVSDGFHPLSHHENNPTKQEQYKLINRYHIEQYAYLLRRMKEVQEGEGALLDHSMVLFGSSISDGNAHSPFETPTLLAGKGDGRIVTGRHIVTPVHTPLCNLYVSMLSAFGIQTDSFGDSAGSVDRLLFSDELDQG